MIFASGSAASEIISAASLISNKLKLALPEMLSKMPLAPSIEVSNNGLLIAILAASAARFSPVAIPIPIKASPCSVMIVLTSAKSRLIKPGIWIKSEMPLIPWRRTSSALPNASDKEHFLSTTCNNLSLGITIIVSTF